MYPTASPISSPSSLSPIVLYIQQPNAQTAVPSYRESLSSLINMPSARNNENQIPQRTFHTRFNTAQLPSQPSPQPNWHAGNSGESNLRDVKPDIEDEHESHGVTAGTVNGATLGTPSIKAGPPKPNTLEKLNKANIPSHSPARVSDWVARHGTPGGQGLYPGMPGPPTPPVAFDPRLDDITYSPFVPTPGMTRPTGRITGTQSGAPRMSIDPRARQLPQAEAMIINQGRSTDNDTPISGFGEDSGMEDQLHSPNFVQDDSPTAAIAALPQHSFNVAAPLIAAPPNQAIGTMNQAIGAMNPPTTMMRPTQRRATLSSQRPRPYPQTPHQLAATPGDRLSRTVLTTRRPGSQPRYTSSSAGRALQYADVAINNRMATGNRATLGNGHPQNASQGRPHALSRDELVHRFLSTGQEVPSVLQEPIYTVPPVDFVSYRSGPGSPADVFSPALGVQSTPQTTTMFPGSSYTPQVVVPGNTYAQTPTVVPVGNIAIDAQGREWQGLGLPRFQGEQVGLPSTPGQVSHVSQMLARASVGTQPNRPPRVAVPTPGHFEPNIRSQAAEAIAHLTAHDKANFADPDHVRWIMRSRRLTLSSRSLSNTPTLF